MYENGRIPPNEAWKYNRAYLKTRLSQRKRAEQERERIALRKDTEIWINVLIRRYHDIRPDASARGFLPPLRLVSGVEGWN